MITCFCWYTQGNRDAVDIYVGTFILDIILIIGLTAVGIAHAEVSNRAVQLHAAQGEQALYMEEEVSRRVRSQGLCTE